ALPITQGAAENFIAWEAENDVDLVNQAPINTIFTIVNDPTASNGGALGEGANNNNPGNTLPGNSFATYTLVFQTAGTYNMYIKYRSNIGGRGDNNSYKRPSQFGGPPGDPTPGAWEVTTANGVNGPFNYTVLQEAGRTYTVNPGDVGNPLKFTLSNR